MITDKIKLLAQLKSQAAKLEAALDAQRPAALAALPAEYGFDSLAAFIKALRQAATAAPAAKPGRKARVAKPAKRKRARVTDEIKAAVKAGLEAGKKAGTIAKEVGISPASVQALKKAFGFTKPRGVAPVARDPVAWQP
jgi:hypothetical protein